ncbi:unnamed protein product [Boreogadus saida]
MSHVAMDEPHRSLGSLKDDGDTSAETSINTGDPVCFSAFIKEDVVFTLEAVSREVYTEGIWLLLLNGTPPPR